MKNSMIALFISSGFAMLLSVTSVMAATSDPIPFYPKTTAQKTRLMQEFDRVFSQDDFKSGDVARPFKFEGRSKWHVNVSLYNRCIGLGLGIENCTKSATVPNQKGTANAPSGMEDEFSITVNSKEHFYSCSAELFVGKEDHELAEQALSMIQETNPSVTKTPFVFVDCTCEPHSPQFVYKAHRATSCDAFGYSTDSLGN